MTLYYETDEILEAVDALKFALKMSKKVKIDSSYWRWIIIPMHLSLQGFMVIWLSSYEKSLVYPAKQREEIRNCEEKGMLIPENLKLSSYPLLFNEVKGNLRKRYNEVVTQKQNSSISELNRIRNDLIHFKPKVLYKSLNDLPELIMDCLNLIELLGWKYIDPFGVNFQYRSSAKMYVYNLRKEMNGLVLMYKACDEN